MSEEFILSKIDLADIDELQLLAKENDGNTDLSKKNFTHWYLDNPIRSNSMWKVSVQNKIEGYATTNNFYYNIDGKDYLVALPQNVLTSENVRGKGLFGKLFYKTEEDNVNENKVDFFLTSTNSSSTPIFLKKFGYSRAVCPPILIKPLNVVNFFKKKTYSIIDDVSQINLQLHYNLPNSRTKDIAYFKWRYSQCKKENLTIILVKKEEEIIGYAFLISKLKHGIKTLLLADIIAAKEENIFLIIQSAEQFASNKLAVALLMFDITYSNKRKRPGFSLKNRFNFLAKGKSEEETLKLSQKPINYFFGDLDYFW